MPSRQKPPLENPPQSITRKYKNGQSKRFMIGRLLGKGGFARCYHLTDAADHSKVYAAKIVQKNWLTKKTEGKLESEIRIHRSLKHDGVVKLYTQFDDEQFVYIILELCPNQTLVEMLRQRKRLTEAEVRYFAIQILLTVHHLHKEGVIHRDLKLGNLFLNDKMQTKLGDFGLATKLESQGERRKTICGTPNYIAPEIITRGGQGHTFPVDVWSIGCILYTLLVGKPPFQSQNLNDTYSKIKESSYSWPSDVRPSRSAVDLVRRMLLVNAEERISVEEVFRHSFFAEPLPQRLPSLSRFQDPTPQLEVFSPQVVMFYGESVMEEGVVGSSGAGLLQVPGKGEKGEKREAGKENELVKHHQQHQQHHQPRGGGLQVRQQPLQSHNPHSHPLTTTTTTTAQKRRPKISSSSTASPAQHHSHHSHHPHHSHRPSSPTPTHTTTALPTTPTTTLTTTTPTTPTTTTTALAPPPNSSSPGSSSVDDVDPSADVPALPSRFFCSLTNKLIQEPIQSPCGHFFNFDDAAEWLSSCHPRAPLSSSSSSSSPSSSPSPRKKPCPVCSTPLSLEDFVFHPDLKLEIEQLRCSRHPRIFLLRNFSFSFACLSHFEKPSSHTPSEASCLCLSGFVKQYLDYSSKYGVAYELFDGKMGAYFNDQSRLVMSRCRSYLQYHPYVPRTVSDSERKSRSKFVSPNCFPPEEAKKMKLINSFAAHFDTLNKDRERHSKQHQQQRSNRFRCHSGSQPQPPQPSSDPFPESPISEEAMLARLEQEKEKHSLPHLEKYHEDSNNYVFILSNGGIQVSFKDGSAIVFYHCNRTFTFLSPWKTIHTYNFTSKNYVKDGQITERLGESERLLMKFGVINRG